MPRNPPIINRGKESMMRGRRMKFARVREFLLGTRSSSRKDKKGETRFSRANTTRAGVSREAT